MNPYGSPQLPRKEKKANALRRIPFLHSHSSGAVSLPQSPVGFRRSVEAALSVNEVPSSSSIPTQHGAAFVSDNLSRPKGEERSCPASPGFPVRSPASPPSSSSLDATPLIFSSSAPTPTSAYFAALRPTPLSPTAKPVHSAHSDTTHNHNNNNNNRPTPPPVNNRPNRNEASVRTPLQGQRQFPQPKKPLPPLPPQHAPHQPLPQHSSAPYPSSSDDGEPKAGPSFQLRNAHISFSSGVRRKRFTKPGTPGETSGGEEEGGRETDSDDEHSFVDSDFESYSPSFSSSSSSYSSSLSSLEALGEESWRDSGEFLSNHNNTNGERSNAAAVAAAFKKRLSSQQQVLGGALAAGHQRGQSPLASSPSSLPTEGGASSRNSWGALPSSSSFQQQQRSVPKRKNSNPWHTWSPHSSSAEGSTSCSLPASPTASSSSVRTVRFSCDPPSFTGDASTKREEAGNDRGEGEEEAKFYYQLLLRQQQQQETVPCWSQPQQPPQEQHSFASYLALQASPSSSSSPTSALGQTGEEKPLTNMSSTAPISSPPPSPSSRNNNKQQTSLLDNDASTLRPVYPKDQQQPQPSSSLLTLNLYAPEKDVGIKLKFTPASTVEEVLTQTIRRLFSDSPEVRRVPWRLCRRTGSPSSHNNKTKKNSGSWLHVTNPISDYILADEEELDVMKPEQAPILIKVVVMETQGTVTCRVDPETTVWELLQNVLFKVHGRAEHPLDEYGLFTVAGKLLNEEHLLSDYSLVNMSKLEFKRIPQLPEAASPSASTTPTLSVTVINLLELENRTEDGQQQQQEQLLTKQMSFPLDISVSDVLSKVIKLFPVKDRHQVALYVPSKRVWLRSDSTLASYSLENDAVLEIRPKYREVTVALPVPTGGKVFETYKFAEEDPAAALYELILFNNPHISDNYTAYTLCTRGGNTLDPKKSIWSYGTNNSRFEVLGKLEPVVVYINGREHKMNVDFTSPVHSIVEMACYKFNLLPVLSVNAMGSGGDDARLQHFVLHSPAGPLVRKSSLRQQGVPTNTTLILKDLREMSGSTGEASQLAPSSTSSSPSPAVSSSSPPAVSSPSRPLANNNLNKGGSKVGPGSLSPSSSSASLSPPSPASALSSSASSSTLERGEPKEVELITIGEEKVNIKWLPATLNIGTEDGSYSGDTLETNIWEEEDSAQTVILSQEKGNEEENDSSGITAATLNKLVSYLTAADTHDIRFMKAIMMTYPSFTNPERLLSKLIERYNVPEGYSAAHVKKVQFRVCNVLKHWITKYFDHFDQALLRSLLEFINQSLIKDGHLSSATTLNNLICKKFQDLQNKNPMDEHNQAMYSAKEKPPPPNVIRNIGKKRNKDKSKSKITRGSEISISQFPRNLWECDEEEVARQLTINEFILYSEIKTSELLEQAWMKKEKQHRCPNVLRMIDNFNLTSHWIAHLILQPLRVKERARRWEFFINVASYLYQLNNFNLLMSFISGMNNSCILRLQHTKATLQKSSLQTLIKLETLMAHEGSYKNYRKELRRVAPPCIPYIGVHLSDLVFIEEGNPDEIEGLINWDKRSLVYRVIDLVGQHQNMRYNLTHVPEFSSFFSTANLPTEQELFQTSLQREPRGAARSQIL